MSVRQWISFTDRQNVCQAMNFVHWQTKCLSRILNSFTDRRNVCQEPTYLIGRSCCWQTFRLSVIPKNQKIWEKITKFIDWQTPFCQCDDLREHFACTDRHFICQSMNLSSLTEEKSVSNEQRVKSNEQRVKEQWCEDIREHLIGDIQVARMPML